MTVPIQMFIGVEGNIQTHPQASLFPRTVYERPNYTPVEPNPPEPRDVVERSDSDVIIT